MSNSNSIFVNGVLQPTSSVTTSSDTITLTGSYSPTDTITITNGGYTIGGATGSSWSNGAGSTVTFTSASGAGGFGGGTISSFNWKEPEEFIDCFPEFNKIKEMSAMYPALKIALDKFRQTYVLVEDDYQAKKGKKYVP